VTLRLVLHNRSGAPQRLQFPSAHTYDVRIAEPGGREIWRWSQGRMFARVLTEVVVEAGGSPEYRVRWSQTTSEGGTLKVHDLDPGRAFGDVGPLTVHDDIGRFPEARGRIGERVPCKLDPGTAAEQEHGEHEHPCAPRWQPLDRSAVPHDGRS
jgi:hypothetical protein